MKILVIGFAFLVACAQTGNQFQTSTSWFHSPAQTLDYGNPAKPVDPGQIAMRYGDHLDETAGILSAASVNDPEARKEATEAIIKISRNRNRFDYYWNDPRAYGFQEAAPSPIDFFTPPQPTKPALKKSSFQAAAIPPRISSIPAASKIPTPTDRKKQFLTSELTRTIGLLSQEPMVPPPNVFSQMLDKNHLVSWFDLERPEPQGVYYQVLGLPLQNHGLLNRTKSEFFRMNKDERERLKKELQPILNKLQGENNPP